MAIVCEILVLDENYIEMGYSGNQCPIEDKGISLVVFKIFKWYPKHPKHSPLSFPKCL